MRQSAVRRCTVLHGERGPAQHPDQV